MKSMIRITINNNIVTQTTKVRSFSSFNTVPIVSRSVLQSDIFHRSAYPTSILPVSAFSSTPSSNLFHSVNNNNNNNNTNSTLMNSPLCDIDFLSNNFSSVKIVDGSWFMPVEKQNQKQ